LKELNYLESLGILLVCWIQIRSRVQASKEEGQPRGQDFFMPEFMGKSSEFCSRQRASPKKRF